MNFLDINILFNSNYDPILTFQVEYASKNPHASLERIENRIYIENYNADNISLLKTAYR